MSVLKPEGGQGKDLKKIIRVGLQTGMASFLRRGFAIIWPERGPSRQSRIGKGHNMEIILQCRETPASGQEA